MLSLSSVYAQRMYEIIMMFVGRGQKVFIYEVARLRAILNYPTGHEYFDFKRKALQIARNEIQQKIGLQFDFTPSRKSGKAVTELRFEVKSTQELINEDVERDLLTAQALQPHEIAAVARNLIHLYKFTQKQQSQILEHPELMNTFIRLHTEIHHGKRVVKNPTAYIAQSLGFGKLRSKPAKAPTPPATSAPTGRSQDPKAIGELITGTVFKPKRHSIDDNESR